MGRSDPDMDSTSTRTYGSLGSTTSTKELIPRFSTSRSVPVIHTISVSTLSSGTL